jgi:hypothetical protein
MNRPLHGRLLRAHHSVVVVLGAIAASPGCQSAPAPFDPFLAGRTTIAPPATAIPAGQAPYYNAQPPTVTVPGGETTIYTPPGAVPAAVPVTPPSSDGSGRFPRGITVPQSNNSTSDTQKDSQLVDKSPSDSGTDNAARIEAPSPAPAPLKFKNSLASPARTSGVVPASFNQPVAKGPIRAGEPAANDSRSQASGASLPAANTNQLPSNPSRTAASSATGRLRELTDFPAATPATPRDLPGYGFDPRYAWLKGKLEFSPGQKRWKLRYIAVEGPTDEYGGSVILPEADKLKGFEPGDFVRIQGKLLETAGGAKGFSRAYSIERVHHQSGERSSSPPVQ